MASVKVAVRVRPFNQRELNLGSSCVVRMVANKTSLVNPNPRPDILDSSQSFSTPLKEFFYDYSYWSFDTEDPDFVPQEQVYDDLGKEVVEDAFEGYNACVFAYGQTGSGKTYTMMGTPDNEGLIPRIGQNLFSRMSEARKFGSSFRTEVSYLEIYNERVKDLLSKNVDESLKVREHPKLGPYVQNLSKHLVTDYSDVQELMARGNAHRTTAATGMNDTSSRSHAIFTIAFSQASFNKDAPRETMSKVNLVDLAGSERANATGSTGQRLKEGGHINKSLVTLGCVIKALADSCQISNNGSPRKPSFIPYRDSVLTWLLKDSLGGNSKTVMIATISPADCNYGETLSTLRYANRAKNIINKPTINEDSNTKLIRDLRAEIERLKLLISEHPTEQPAVIEKVHENEAKVKLLTEEWTEKWKETQRILQEQRTLGLRKFGLGVVLDSDMPHLVGIDDDLLSTGITLYHLKEGQTKIGTEFAGCKQDIILHGHDIEDEHCLIELKDGDSTLVPLNDSICYVNTEQISQPTKLSQGCLILLGRNNMFRFNDPIEVNRLRKEKLNGSMLNLSRVLGVSSNNLTKSTDNLWSPTVVECCDIDLEEKKREILELEEEHERAEKRRMEEAERIDEDLRRKQNELERIKRESDEIRKVIVESQQKVKETEEQLRALQEKKAQFVSLAGDDLLVVRDKTEAVRAQIVDHLNVLNNNETSESTVSDILKKVYDKLENDIQNIESDYLLRKCSTNETSIGEELILNNVAPSSLFRKEIASDKHQGTSFTPDLLDLSDSEVCDRLPHKSMDDSCVQVSLSLQCEAFDLNSNTKEISTGDIAVETDSLYSYKLSELKDFERQLLEMENKLKEQQTLFEMQRNKELAHIEKEKENLKEMEKQVKLDEIIEKEVKRRLQEHQLRFEEEWRQGLELRAASYLRITSSPSPPSTPTQSRSASIDCQTLITKLTFAECEDMSETISVNIPSYVFKNSSFDSHFEYEIQISVNNEKWTIFRRFRKFREFHLIMKKYYGTKIVLPYFPPRTCFGKNNVYLADTRRRLLEKYLKELIIRCQQVKGCPLYCSSSFEEESIDKSNLFNFSDFFKEDCEKSSALSG